MYKVQRISFANVFSLMLFIALVLGAINIFGQQQSAQSTTPSIEGSKNVMVSDAHTDSAGSPPKSKSTAVDDRYHIGPGDVLEVRFYKRPENSRDNVSVDGRGMITMPLIEGEIQASCLTENQLASELEKRYQKYYKNPHLDVFIKQYNSQQVAVIGAVLKPTRFQLQRRVRLLQLIALTDGLKDKAGRNINIIHDPSAFTCDQPTLTQTTAAIGDGSVKLSTYYLRDLLNGDEKANPYVMPGDIITIPDADEFYVVGNVLRPSPFFLKDQVTLSQAIAMAGGTLPASKLDKIKLVRVSGNSGKREEAYYDLKAIQKKKAPDIVLQAGDIIEVNTSTGSLIARDIIRGLGGVALQAPLRAVTVY